MVPLVLLLLLLLSITGTLGTMRRGSELLQHGPV